MKSMLLASASVLLLSGAAMAQPAATGSTPQHLSGAALQTQVQQNLQQAGFSDIKIVPDSFLVQAKDKSGNPITMMINPDSVTEVLAMGPNGTAPAGTAPAGTTAGNGPFVSVPATDRMSTQLVGTVVRSNDNKELGTIKDLAFNGPNLQAYIVKTIAGRAVAVSPSAVQMIWDHASNTWHATMNATEAELQQAPAYSPA